MASTVVTPWASISSSQRRPWAASSSVVASRVARDGREDAAAGGQDLEVAGALLSELQLALAAAGEQQVGVRIDEARGHRPAGRVEHGELLQVVALGREERPQVGLAAHAEHPAVPAGDGGAIRTAAVRDAPVDLALVRAHPRTAGNRHDLARRR